MIKETAQREFAVDVIRKLRDAGYVALFAGGCVRDLLLQRKSKDFDVATTARPDQVRQLFGHKRTLAVGASFGVIVVVGPRDVGHVEVATFRTEGEYLDGRRPESVAFSTPEEDAKRRDFTINGMFFDPIDERVFDFVGGETDLHARTVRAIGNPWDRMCEDKLRMLRAVRFTATLQFTLDPATADAIRQMSAQLVVVSAERIAQELKRMLIDEQRRYAIELTRELGLLPVIFPELVAERQREPWSLTMTRLEQLQQPSFELSLAALLKSLPAKPIVHDICRRLKLSNDEVDRVVWLVQHQADLNDAPGLSLAALKRCLAHPYHEDLLRLMDADGRATESGSQAYDFCRRFLLETSPTEIDPPHFVTGDDLIELGLRPSPHFKQVLDAIRDAQLNEEIDSREAALALVKSDWIKSI